MNRESMIWVNGELLPVSAAHISPLDRGFTLGDGLFETIRVRAGEILRLDLHLARLRQGAKVLDFPLLWPDAELEAALWEMLVANQLQEAFVRLTASRGVPSERGLLPDKNAKPSLVIQCGSFSGYPAELYQRGIQVVTSTIRRNEHSPLANVKSLNYLDNILARKEAAAWGVDDVLMLNTAGTLVCASAANLFFVQEGRVVTPPLSAGVLPGTMRAYMIDVLAPSLGLEVVTREVMPGEVKNMDEVFLTNALIGIMPIVDVDEMAIGNGKPGNITRRLWDTLA